ncbi:MAG: GGDEF domain-containing protein [Lachnospiraceae bacterium]|nr:GGDEF domain-containing protein [Lachnospiraceae bacterium]
MRSDRGVKYVGLIMEDIFTDFAKEVIHGISNAAKERSDIRLVLLVGRQNEKIDLSDKQCMYKTVYNTIYRLEENCRFDGLILTIPNMWAVEMDSFGLEKISNYSQIPKVFVATNKNNETTVNYDNETGIREAVEYLVNTRGVTRLCMLGGRDDNADAMARKKIFEKCLAENQLEFNESMYEKTDMSATCYAEAGRLLDRNPDVQAIFCVNDPAAVALYIEMEKRRLVPGKDILVFGFDNTLTSSAMVPPLASIGPAEETLGKRALEVLLEKMNGRRVKSVVLPTSLYGRASCPYEKYDFTTRDLIKGDTTFINRMFDECFYRYKNEYFDSKTINLRRLFYEIVSRMLYFMKRRYMSEEEYEQIISLIDIFFDNGAMDYTDATKFLQSVERLQNGMNLVQRSLSTNTRNNRLFVRMKDRAIESQAGQKSKKNIQINSGRGIMQDFLIETTDYDRSGSSNIDNIVKHFDMLGLPNAALYLYDEPVDYHFQGITNFPTHINLRCITKNQALYVLPRDRQDCAIENIFMKKELPSKGLGYVPFPVFFGTRIYGILICELTQEIAERGEYVVSTLSRVIYVNDMEVINSPSQTEKVKEDKRTQKEQEIFSQIAEGLASHYDIIYYVNSVSSKYMEFRANNIFGNLVVQEEGRDFFSELRVNVSRLLHPEDKARMVEILGKDRMISMLEDRKQFHADYRMIIDGKTQYMRLTIMWGSDRVHFIIGVENINEEVRREEEHIRALKMANELARKDGLTGAKNLNAYREVEESIQRELADGVEDIKFAIVVCDINNLKYVNDTFGHAAGDEYIKSACKLIFDTFSHSPVFRVGGDEFVVVLMGTDFENGDQLMKQIHSAVLENQRKNSGPIVAVGVAVFDKELDEKVSDVFERADRQMYRDKNHLKKLKAMEEI